MTKVAHDLVVYGLYCLCHPADGIRYVGQSAQSDKRFLEHLSSSLRGAKKYPVNNWILKHGVDNIAQTVLEVCLDKDDLDSCEIRWIACLATHKDSNPRGLNLTIGGGGTLGHVHSPETRARLSDARLGKPLSDYHKKRISEGKTGKGNGRPVTRKPRKDGPRSIERVPRGSQNHFATIDDEMAMRIHQELQEPGANFRSVARNCGVSRWVVRGIGRGETWKHLFN